MKIDKSFVDTIETQSVAGTVTAHIIDMAHSLGVEIIAEGVESRQQAEYLKNHGVQYGQGWLFGKPMEATALKEYVAINKNNTASELESR